MKRSREKSKKAATMSFCRESPLASSGVRWAVGGSSGANLGFIFCGLIFVLLDGYSATRIFGKWGSNEFFLFWF